MLAVVRRPDKIFQFETYTAVKKSSRVTGRGAQAAAAPVIHQETAQATALMLRLIVVAHHAASTVARLVRAAKNVIM